MKLEEKKGCLPYKGGDEHYIATNNLTPVSRHDEIIDAQVKSKDTSNDDKLKNAISKEDE